MVYKCSCCGRFIDAEAEPVDHLCEQCRGSGGEAAADRRLDWRKPLYDNAVSVEQSWSIAKIYVLDGLYLRLSGYRDADARRAAIHERARKEVEREAEIARSSESLADVERALQRLREMNGYGDSAAAITQGEARLDGLRERERAQREEEERREKRRKLRMRMLMVAVAAVIAAGIATYSLILVPGYVRKGDEALAQKQYVEAVNNYEKAGKMDRLNEARTAWGEELLAQRDFEGAIEQFEEAGDEESKGRVISAWGEQLLSDGEYEAAVEKFQEREDESAVQKAYLAWSDHLAEEGSAQEALEILENVAEGPERQARFDDLQMRRADECLNLLRERREVDSAYARELGEPIASLDAQLHYCHGLAALDYDLMEVYPDGVDVEGVSLARYQYDGIEDTDAELDLSKMLVFMRTERPYTGISSTPHDRSDDENYSVKLLPGQLFSCGADRAAHSWEEASCVVMLDDVYIQEGSITTQYVSSSSSRFSGLGGIKLEHPFYGAVSFFGAYDKDDPNKGRMLDYNLVDPICADESWFELHKSGDESLEVENRVAKFDHAEIYENMVYELMVLMLF